MATPVAFPSVDFYVVRSTVGGRVLHHVRLVPVGTRAWVALILTPDGDDTEEPTQPALDLAEGWSLYGQGAASVGAPEATSYRFRVVPISQGDWACVRDHCNRSGDPLPASPGQLTLGASHALGLRAGSVTYPGGPGMG